jgi:hypothetical protein
MSISSWTTSAETVGLTAKPMPSELTIEAVIMDMLEGQYQNPVRVVGFNTAEKWSQDVSADVAHELRKRCDLQMRDVPFFLQGFVDRYEGRYHDYQLPLPMRLV